MPAKAGIQDRRTGLATLDPRFRGDDGSRERSRMSKLNLTLACWDYDRTRALMDRVTAEGVDINYLPMPVEETFFRMLRHREFDVAELSLSSYSVSLSRPEKPFIAIPVFPSRMFRHSSIYVSAK